MFFHLNWNREYEMECTPRQVTLVHGNKRIKDVKWSLKWEPFWWQISSSVHLIAVHHNIIVSQCFCVWRLWSEGESTKFLSKHSSCHSHWVPSHPILIVCWLKRSSVIELSRAGMLSLFWRYISSLSCCRPENSVSSIWISPDWPCCKTNNMLLQSVCTADKLKSLNKKKHCDEIKKKKKKKFPVALKSGSK